MIQTDCHAKALNYLNTGVAKIMNYSAAIWLVENLLNEAYKYEVARIVLEERIKLGGNWQQLFDAYAMNYVPQDGFRAWIYERDMVEYQKLAMIQLILAISSSKKATMQGSLTLGRNPYVFAGEVLNIVRLYERAVNSGASSSRFLKLPRCGSVASPQLAGQQGPIYMGLANSSLTWTASTSAKVNNPYSSFVFDWGDGVKSTSDLAAATHTYAQAGQYRLQLTPYIQNSTKACPAVSASVQITGGTPLVTNISPAIATLNTPTIFTVTGTNLPLTAVLSMADVVCQTPTNRAASGFTVSCTPTLVGSKVITITMGNTIDTQWTVNVSAAAVATGTLNDTGITANQCYQAGSDVLVSCSSASAIALNNAQDGMIGRDVAVNNNVDGKGGFSFSSVAGGCVKDNVTGLMWEVKTTDGGLRDWTKTYTHYDSTLTAQKWNGVAYVAPTQAEIDAPTNSIGFVNAVNAQGLCGFNNWRLPTADELQGIVDYGAFNPSIDATWFPNTQANVFWSASPSVGGTNYAWYVYFNYGNLYYYSRYNSLYVRLVRASQ